MSETPNILAPFTIHSSFHKGARYLPLDLITTDLEGTGRGILTKIVNVIDDDIIMIAASAPCWPYANVDPIPQMAALATEAGLWMHVDACVGGYISPCLEKHGTPLTPCEFRSLRVMSTSAAPHRLTYCPKPTSTMYW